jgi:hypothetical protein
VDFTKHNFVQQNVVSWQTNMQCYWKQIVIQGAQLKGLMEPLQEFCDFKASEEHFIVRQIWTNVVKFLPI